MVVVAPFGFEEMLEWVLHALLTAYMPSTSYGMVLFKRPLKNSSNDDDDKIYVGNDNVDYNYDYVDDDDDDI